MELKGNSMHLNEIYIAIAENYSHANSTYFSLFSLGSSAPHHLISFL